MSGQPIPAEKIRYSTMQSLLLVEYSGCAQDLKYEPILIGRDHTVVVEAQAWL